MIQRRTADPENGVSCPSCGQPVTSQRWCPHCGAETGRRLRLSVLCCISLLTALIGTLLVWRAARSTEVPAVRISDVRSDMDWAYVRLAGVVTRHPFHEPSSGQLAFWLDDGTGEIRVTAYRPVSDRVLEASPSPAMGDRVSVEGTLRLRGDLQQLVISLPASVRVERPAPVALPIAALTEEHLFRKVCVCGQVRGKRIPYDGLALLSLRDATGAVDIVAEEGLGSGFAAALSVATGEYVEFCGTATTYAGKLQIALDVDTVAVARLTPVAVAPLREASGIGQRDVGQFARVRGTVSAIAQLGSGVRLLVEDGSGSIAVVVWTDVAGGPERVQSLTRGSRVDVQGCIVEYRGQLELVPEIAGDILDLAPAAEEAAQLRLDELRVDRLGDTVTVAAQIVYSVPSSSGVRFALREGDAEGYLLAWPGWLAACPVAGQLVPGALVTVSGVVALNEGQLEIVPQRPGDVVVTGMGAIPAVADAGPALPTPHQVPAEATRATEATRAVATPAARWSPTPAVAKTGHVPPEASGTYLTVQGRIVDLVLFASGQRCALDDGSGALALWLPSERFAALYGGAEWTFGSIVRVHGQVQLYKGDVELEPDGPGNVQVVTAGPAQPEQVTRMGDLRESHVGERLTVEGRVIEVKPFSQGIKFLLDDGSGRLTVLLWQSVLDDLQDRECLAVSRLVRATGRVSEYQGALELAPGIGRDVRCLP